MEHDAGWYPVPFLDERVEPLCCAYCGKSEQTTLDHVPPRVFLDSPLPSMNPIGVRACKPCNLSFSAAEEYVAVLLDVICHGAADVSQWRHKTRRAVSGNTRLLSRAASAAANMPDRCDLAHEDHGVGLVMRKLAVGHWAMNMGDRSYTDPSYVSLHDGAGLSFQKIDAYVTSTLGERCLFPEVGSKAFISAVTTGRTSVDLSLIHISEPTRPY